MTDICPKHQVELTSASLCVQCVADFSTADPLYTVQRKVRDYGYDPDYAERFAWIDAEGREPVTRESDPELFVKLEAWHDAGEPLTASGGATLLGEEEAGREDMWTRTGYVERWEIEQAFLTYDAALAYRQSEAHNLGESRVYVESGHRNPEWRWLRALLGAGAPK